MAALGPFVWRRAVDPTLVDDMAALLARARVEAGPAASDDLKIGVGGIREVEFFAQGLQLVWGGREPRVRTTNTIEAILRIRDRARRTRALRCLSFPSPSRAQSAVCVWPADAHSAQGFARSGSNR